MELLVVGAGEMGRWFARSVDPDVAFADLDPEAAEAAAADLRGEVGRRIRAVPLDAGESFGAVCVAVPMPAAVEAVETHGPKAQQAVVDVTGSMGPPLSAMARTVPQRERVSFHPLFSAASAPGTVAVATGASGPATDRLRAMLADAGNDLVETDAGAHDRAMATVQGRAHAAVLAFALAADDVPDGLTTPVFEALVGVAADVTGNEPRVYADVQDAFGGAADVAAAAERLADADPEEFAALYGAAGDWLDGGGGDDATE